jgi:hypothetical protein
MATRPAKRELRNQQALSVQTTGGGVVVSTVTVVWAAVLTTVAMAVSTVANWTAVVTSVVL